MMKPLLRFPLLICLGLLISNFSAAQQPIMVDSASQLNIGKNISYFIPNKEINFSETLRHSKFLPCTNSIPNLGIHKQSVWLKFTVDNIGWSDLIVLEICNPTINQAELFFKKGQGDTAHFVHVLIDKSNLNSRNQWSDPLFRLDRYSTSQTYYLRVKSNQPLILPININFPSTQLLHSSITSWINGIYFGSVVIMALYNFFLFLSIKDRSYLYYVAFILFSGLTQLKLKGFGLIWSFRLDSFFVESHSMIWLASISGIMALLFTHKFLHIKRHSTVLGKFILLLIIPFIIAIILSLLNYYIPSFLIMRLNTGLSTLGILLVAIYILKKDKSKVSMYFLAAWIFLILGSLVYLLTNYGILSYSELNNYSVQIGSTIEMVLLSFALANRINSLREERDRARVNELTVARKNQLLISNQKTILEKTVNERTYELKLSNTALNESLQQLKQTQAQLVATEKMSSLGQLTAGIAHEINNPINFVSANVLPLKRDIEQLFETISKIEAIGTQEKPAAEKKAEIASYKEETDLSYVQQEINQLLKGIHEGAYRTATIVKGLRTFSRMDEDTWKEADINEGLESTLAITANTMRGINIETHFERIPLVTCNPGKLNQVFLNIITNSIFAIHERHGTNIGGNLTISTFMEKDKVVVSIKDDGIGMDEATKRKVFEPFFTTKPVGKGTGLGMSISFSILEQHQATCNIISEFGKGTEFIIKLFIHPPKLPKNNKNVDIGDNVNRQTYNL